MRLFLILRPHPVKKHINKAWLILVTRCLNKATDYQTDGKMYVIIALRVCSPSFILVTSK